MNRVYFAYIIYWTSQYIKFYDLLVHIFILLSHLNTSKNNRYKLFLIHYFAG